MCVGGGGGGALNLMHVGTCICKVRELIVMYIHKSLSLQVTPDCKVIILPKEEVDKANKDKKHFPTNFQVSTSTVWSLAGTLPPCHMYGHRF